MSPVTWWLLAALQLDGVGVAAVRKLAREIMAEAGTLDAIVASQKNRLLGHNRSELVAEEKAARIAEACAAHSIAIISLADPEYPPQLKGIKDAPPILYVRGNRRALAMPGCAVVGTRKSSRNGDRIAQRIAGALARRDILTVSGLALGIDAASHAGALAAGGATVAIMAHGLDTIHPASNRKLGQLLVESGGALVSEHEPGVPPRPAEFVRRNRIQSGMSLCSIIVESGAIGGSIHQARFTKEQGRTIFAVIPDLANCSDKSFNFEGGRYLIQSMGAVPLTTAEELDKHLSRLLASLEDPTSYDQGRLRL